MNGNIAAVNGLAERTTNLFRSMLLDMAARLGSDADWHAAVMAVESGFRPAIQNSIGATGLIQFMPTTAHHLGTSTDELASMTAEEQLFYVEKYYHSFTNRMHSVEDVYMATFMPSMVGRGSDNVISVEGEAVYEANKGLDRDHDGVITNGDVGATARAQLQAAATRPRIEVIHEEMVDESPLPKLRSYSSPDTAGIASPSGTKSVDDDCDPYAEDDET